MCLAFSLKGILLFYHLCFAFPSELMLIISENFSPREMGSNQPTLRSCTLPGGHGSTIAVVCVVCPLQPAKELGMK